MAIWVFSKAGGFKLYPLYYDFSYLTRFLGLVGKEKAPPLLVLSVGRKNVPVECAFFSIEMF